MTIEELKMMDLEELLRLKKKIDKQIAEKDHFTKSDTGVRSGLHEIFHDRFSAIGVIGNDYNNIIGKMEKSVFYLCDISLKNYKVENTKCRHTAKEIADNPNSLKGVTCNGSLILSDQNNYKAMCYDIMSVITKYAE